MSTFKVLSLTKPHADSVEHFLLRFGFGSGLASPNFFVVKGRERDPNSGFGWVIQGVILSSYIGTIMSHYHWMKGGFAVVKKRLVYTGITIWDPFLWGDQTSSRCLWYTFEEFPL